MKIKLNKEIFNIIKGALLKSLINDCWKMFPLKAIQHLVQFVDYSDLSDRFMADNEEMHDFIKWEKVNRLQLIRIIARNIKILEKVDIKSKEYKIRELIPLLRMHSGAIFFFNIDLDTIVKEDAFLLLMLGHKIYLDKINVKNYDFNFREVFDVLESYRFNEEALVKFDLTTLKSRQVAEIMTYNIDVVNIFGNQINMLTALDWLNVLEKRSELFDLCDLKKFEECDVYKTIELLVLMGEKVDLSYMIDNRNINEISPLGWVKLIIHNPDKYLPLCEPGKLNNNHWNEINLHHPELKQIS